MRVRKLQAKHYQFQYVMPARRAIPYVVLTDNKTAKIAYHGLKCHSVILRKELFDFRFHDYATLRYSVLNYNIALADYKTWLPLELERQAVATKKAKQEQKARKVKPVFRFSQ